MTTVEQASDKSMPLVSAIVPCLNRAPFLRRTIDSILDQNYPHIECIVVDGGSTDDTVDILRSYGERVRWVSEPDRGHSHAINKGWEMSTGDILTWINADDAWVVPDAAATAVDYLVKHPEVDVVYGDSTGTDDDGNIVGMAYGRPFDLEHAVVHCDHCIPQPAALMRRSILEAVGWLDESFLSKKDHELWLRIALKGTIRHIPALIAHSRFDGGYMASRGDITAQACVDLTKKFYGLDGVPAEIRKRERRAMSNAYLRGVDYAQIDGDHWPVIRRFLVRAWVADPTNLPTVAATARRQLSIRSLGDQRLRRRLAPVRSVLMTGRALRDVVPNTRSWAAIKDQRTLSGAGALQRGWMHARVAALAGGTILDVSYDQSLAVGAAEQGHAVTCAALRSPVLFHPSLRYITALDHVPLASASFDAATSMATLERIGVPGQTTGLHDADPDGDLILLNRIGVLVRCGGSVVISVPVGIDQVFNGERRIYGGIRLDRLCSSFDIVESAFWAKNPGNRWQRVERDEALKIEARPGPDDATTLGAYHALGMFVLQNRPCAGTTV